MTPPPRNPPPLPRDLGFPDLPPEQLSVDDRTAYALQLDYDGRNGKGENSPDPGGETVDETCTPEPGEPCPGPNARAKLRIEPVIGSNFLNATNLKDGWRVVARITLLDLRQAYPPMKLKRATPVVWWWVGPATMSNGATGIESRFYNAVDANRVNPARMRLHGWKDAPTGPTDAKAVWKKTHAGNPIPYDGSLGIGYGVDIGPTARAAAVFEDQWFACDAGCCGARLGF